MDENKDYNEEKIDEYNVIPHKHTGGWIKFALVLIVLFLACYLAVYYVLDQMRHAYYMPAMPVESIDRILQEQDRMFERDMSAFPMHDKAMMVVKNPVETYKDDNLDAYKMIINLKPFNNNPDNLSIDIQSNKVSIKGKTEKTGKHSEKVYAFSQSFILPENIDIEKVSKQKHGHKYIITMPIDD